MTIKDKKLKCPVCGLENVSEEVNKCPQCDADLSCFKALDNIPDVSNSDIARIDKTLSSLSEAISLLVKNPEVKQHNRGESNSEKIEEAVINERARYKHSSGSADEREVANRTPYAYIKILAVFITGILLGTILTGLIMFLIFQNMKISYLAKRLEELNSRLTLQQERHEKLKETLLFKTNKLNLQFTKNSISLSDSIKELSSDIGKVKDSQRESKERYDKFITETTKTMVRLVGQYDVIQNDVRKISEKSDDISASLNIFNTRINRQFNKLELKLENYRTLTSDISRQIRIYQKKFEKFQDTYSDDRKEMEEEFKSINNRFKEFENKIKDLYNMHLTLGKQINIKLDKLQLNNSYNRQGNIEFGFSTPLQLR